MHFQLHDEIKQGTLLSHRIGIEGKNTERRLAGRVLGKREKKNPMLFVVFFSGIFFRFDIFFFSRFSPSSPSPTLRTYRQVFFRSDGL